MALVSTNITGAEQIKSFFTSSSNNMFRPVSEAHMPTVLSWSRVDPLTVSLENTGGRNVQFVLPRTVGQMMHTIMFRCRITVTPKVLSTDLAIPTIPVVFKRRFGQRLIDRWSLDHLNKNLDRGDSEIYRIHSNLFLSSEDYLAELRSFNAGHEFGALKSNDGALRRSFISTASKDRLSVYDADRSMDNAFSLDLEVEIPWWGSWSINNVLPIYNFRDAPVLTIDLAPMARLLSGSWPLISTAYKFTIDQPHLRCLFYNIGREPFNTLFPFSGNVSWHKPDYQVQTQRRNDLAPGKTTTFRITGINTVVHTFVVTVRKTYDLDTIQDLDKYQRAIKSMFFIVNGERLGTRTETFDGDWMLTYYKPRYFTPNYRDTMGYQSEHPNPEDFNYNNNWDDTKPTPIYAYTNGLRGHISQPGYGTINFQNINNDFNLVIEWNDTMQLGTEYQVDITAIAVNVVTYEAGFMHKQITM